MTYVTVKINFECETSEKWFRKTEKVYNGCFKREIIVSKERKKHGTGHCAKK